MPTCGRPSRTAMLTVLSLPGQGALPDVAPEVHAGPPDAIDGGIGLGHRRVDRVAEHTPAVGDQPAVVDPRAGVKHHPVGPAREMLEAVYPPPPVEPARVALGGEHHAHRRARVPLDRLAREPALAGAHEELEQVRAEAGEDDLRLGVAEAYVELEHLRAPVVEHEARIEHPGVGRALL